MLLVITVLFLTIRSFSQSSVDLCFNASIYKKPDLRSEVLTVIPKGKAVQTLEMVKLPNDWDIFFRVSYLGIEGWIYQIDLVYNDNFYNAIAKTKWTKDYILPKISSSDSISKNAPAVSSGILIVNPSYKTSVSNPYSVKVINLTLNKSGTYTIPCKVNGLKMSFIFDTGASDVSISMTEALFMIKNGYLDEKEIFGTEYYQIANGDIQEGTKIIIRELEFDGLKLFNVEASVVHNLDAPLLLGQTAISLLGKIQIDFNKNILTVIK
jgi:clan AA aspartic protease (TIGR02281 family)